jgi:L-rhamnose mutarotase
MRRHQDWSGGLWSRGIWPELVSLLKEAGASDYSIYFDPATNALFAVLCQVDDDRMANIGENPVMQKWWAYMADIMVTREDNIPVTGELINVFQLP